MIRITKEQLALYQSLFRGRTDVYAKRWEKNGKSGYGPAYQLNWDEFFVHRSQGGTMATFKHKTTLPLTTDVVCNHLIGRLVVGVYPLLKDNTSNFIAADFDGEQAFNEARRLIKVCGTVGLSAYLEQSRSGQGTHAWLFFNGAYPAARSRIILLECIRQALGLSAFDKEVSFDRLFPNQELSSGRSSLKPLNSLWKRNRE